MKKIIAAGGLVFNDRNELLMIFRRGKWDLPKGKLDEGESIEACAVREVEEETGVKDLEPQYFLGLTLHEYFDTYLHKNVVKETHWFVMNALKENELIPQSEEDIEKIEWVEPAALDHYLANTYKNIAEIIGIYYQKHPQ